MATVLRQPTFYIRRVQSLHAALHNLQNSESFQLPLQQNLPPGKQSFVNPTLRKRNPQDHEDSFKLPLQQNLPPGDTIQPRVLRSVVRPRQDWIQSTPTTLMPVVAADAPSIAENWPVPRSQSRYIADWTNYILPQAQAPPNSLTDWPNPPRAARRSPQDWLQSPFIPTIPPDEPAALPLMGQIWME